MCIRDRYVGTERLAIMGAVLLYGGCAVLCISHVLLRNVYRREWTGFALTEQSVKDGATRESFIRDATIQTQSVVLHSFIGTAGAFLAWRSVSWSAATEGVVVHTGSRIEECNTCAGVYLLGHLFGAWAFYQLTWLLLGWQKGFDNWAHHLMFCTIAVINPYFFTIYEATGFALAMEISSPALSAMIIFRSATGRMQLLGSTWDYREIETAAGLVFCPVFLVVRVLLFGYGLWRSVQVWFVQPESVMVALGSRASGAKLIQGIYFAAWLLQLFWARIVVKKVLRKIRGQPKKHLEADNAKSK
eukprot:TRINITY_DN3340_c0_g1_i2.p1 TRINITY_DN3340_c0_g1~~TRINITY_DN3340_c0_g1_i2.p1  ORF type:complete len:302 (+),score=74.53 TRINITY_DN3340_c0_g1_i2:126-1031(+)